MLDELNANKEQDTVNVQSPSFIPNEEILYHDGLPRSDRRLSGPMSHVQINPAEVQKVIVEHIVKSDCS